MTNNSNPINQSPAGANPSPVSPEASQSQTFTIRQASELLSVKTGTLRHYCNLGLVPGLKRSRTGYRIFSAVQIDQLRNIIWLYRCGLTSREVKTYFRSSPTVQKQILNTKKQQLWQKLDDIRQNIDFIERQEDLLDQP